MQIKSIFKKFNLGTISLLAIASLMMIAATPVYAKSLENGPFGITAISSKFSDDQLAAMFQHDQTWYIALRDGVKQESGQVITSTRLSSDTTAGLVKTEKDFATYKNDLVQAERVQTEVQSMLKTHAGFAADGTVLNSRTAARTLSTLNMLLRNSQYWLGRANVNFAQANLAR